MLKGAFRKALHILITNTALALRAGSELYVRDVAAGLLKRGHTPIVYSPYLGEVAREIRNLTIPVVDNLALISKRPDLIHGQHHLETMAALLHFPHVPAVFFCHGWLPWEEAPPLFPRILRYVAVDQTCRDRLLYEHAIPEDRILDLLNFVDLQRFKPRGPLPAKPERALVFSNRMVESKGLGAVREACDRAGIKLDVAGFDSGHACAEPEKLLKSYDLVFAKGKSALEALASGTAVILCDTSGTGPMVTTGNLDLLRQLNFGIRTLQDSVSAAVIERELALYNPEDAKEVSRRLRTTVGMETAIDEIVALYQEVFDEYQSNKTDDVAAEGRAAAVYLRGLADHFRIEKINSPTWQLRDRLIRVPVLGSLARSIARKASRPSSS